jgi:hypothetical protein
MMRMRILIRPNDADPCGSGSGSATLLQTRFQYRKGLIQKGLLIFHSVQQHLKILLDLRSKREEKNFFLEVFDL